jgi:hypothetical protein
MMNCQTFQQNPESEPLNTAAQAHAAACAACASWRETQAAVSRLVGELPRANAPADFDFRLRARLARAQTPRVGYGWLRVPAGATLAGLLAFGAWWNFSTSTPTATTAGNLVSTTSLAQLPQPQIEVRSDDNDAPYSGTVQPIRTNSSAFVVATRQNRSRPQAAPPRKVRIGDGFALRPLTTPDAGREAVSLPRPAAPSVKVELHNQRTGRRALYINALTFGREVLPRTDKAEDVIW